MGGEEINSVQIPCDGCDKEFTQFTIYEQDNCTGNGGDGQHGMYFGGVEDHCHWPDDDSLWHAHSIKYTGKVGT